MARKAVSVTLEADNLLWLRGQVRSAPGQTLSAVLDRLVSEARSRGHVHEASIRSVVGTIGIADDDPNLEKADAIVRSAFPEPRGRRPRTSASKGARG